MRVFFHIRRPEGGDWQNTEQDFEEIPRAGDLVALSSTGPFGVVSHVEWIAQGADTTYQVEVFALEVDLLRFRKEAFERAKARIAGSD